MNEQSPNTWKPAAAHIVLPVVLTVILFVFTEFFITMPFIQKSMMNSKREMLKELVTTTCELLNEYENRVKSGELTLKEAQEKAKKRIRALRYGDNLKDYFWINDMHPNMVMHPYMPELEGKSISHMKDSNNKSFTIEFVEKVKEKGGGFVDYEWQFQDDKDSIVPKLSYVKGFKPWGWIIGTGIYIEDIREKITAVTWKLSAIFITILLIVLFISAYIIWQGKKADAERARAEKALRDNEEKFRTIFNSSFEFIGTLLPDGTLAQANQAALDFSKSEESQIGKIFWETCWWNKSPEIQEQLKRAFERSLKGETVRYETYNYDTEGNKVLVDFSLKPVKNEAGEIVLLIAEGHDISELKRAEEEMNSMRKYLKNVFDSMPSILVGVDPEGFIIHWNMEAEKQTGMPLEKVIGQPLENVLPRLKNQMGEIKKALVKRQPRHSGKVAEQINGETRYSDIMIFPLIANGIKGAVVRIDDISDRVRLEEMMIQTEKMMSVGGLAAGMAHEINNPLGGIMLGAQNMRRRLSPELPKNVKVAEEIGLDLKQLQNYLEKREIDSCLDGIIKSVERAATIIANMLQFSRRSDSDLKAESLPELIERTLELASNDYDLKKRYDFRHLEIIREFEPSLPKVFCVATEIEQVVLNLLKNAAQAMGEAKMTKAPRIMIRLKSEGDMAQIEIEDNGPGIPESVRKRIFEPFFTTKPVGQGTGLGLSVSYMIITNNHHGKMEVESTPGVGTTFIISLPIERTNGEIKIETKREFESTL
jgi:PAS domain S-box-containing protein